MTDLYQLLPAFLRYRDWYEGEPLRALTAVLETQYRTLEEDVGQLYDDWFIETCQDRLAPYLGDLIGARGLEQPEAWVPTQRARIANTLIYRQLKGTTAVVARAARDVTGWPCRAVPFFELLAVSQSLERLRPGRGGTVDVRDLGALARLDGPFDELPRRPQISGSAANLAGGPRDGYNLSRLGLFFWRLKSYPVVGRTARRRSVGCYSFHPLGIDQPLFSRLHAPEEPTAPVVEAGVPGPISRQALAAELAARRAGREPATDFLGAAPAFEIVDRATRTVVPWSSIEVADLTGWRRPAGASSEASEASEEAIRLAVDPELGRLAFAEGAAPAGRVQVSYSYGFGDDLGSGPYRRPEVFAVEPGEAAPGRAAPGRAAPGRAAPGRAETARDLADARTEELPSLLAALDARPRDAEVAYVQISDNATQGGSAGLVLELELKPGSWLILEAAPGAAPCFVGDLRVKAAGDDETGGASAGRAGRLSLSGLILGGRIELACPVQLDLRHCTLRPPAASSSKPRQPESCIAVTGDQATASTVRVDSSLVGPLWLPPDLGSLEIVDSVVDGGDALAIAADASGGPGPGTSIARSTLLGGVSVTRLIHAEDVLFTAEVAVERRHEGVVRHSYLPPGSWTPRRELCQPDLALEEVSGEVEVSEVLARLKPSFTSRVYGQPGYAQLSRPCPRQIRSGASNGSEMGVFQGSRNALREANLPGILEEYLPWGMEPRIVYVT